MIVRQSAMQRVAAELAPSPAMLATPAMVSQRRVGTETAPRPVRFSDLTPDDLAALRIERALEACYPQCGDRSTRILAGYETWRAKQSAAPANPQPVRGVA